jgi:hypothetical protein
MTSKMLQCLLFFHDMPSGPCRVNFLCVRSTLGILLKVKIRGPKNQEMIVRSKIDFFMSVERLGNRFSVQIFQYIISGIPKYEFIMEGLLEVTTAGFHFTFCTFEGSIPIFWSMSSARSSHKIRRTPSSR